MRDGINLTRAGHPVVVFVQDHFERAARAQAKALGAPDLRIYVYPQYRTGGLSPAQEERKALQAAQDFPELLRQAHAG